ncbi:MAG: glycosyltransferase, partial [Planctomycetota bacterium]
MLMDEPKPLVAARPEPIRLSVVAPAHNEEGNVERLVDEIGAALEGVAFEFIIVDDASTDGTVRIAESMMETRPWLRVISLSRPAAGGGNGQSAAFKAGFA